RAQRSSGAQLGRPEFRRTRANAGTTHHRARAASAQPQAEPGADHLQPKPSRGRLMPAPAGHTFPALGTFATVLTTDPAALEPALAFLAAEVHAVDVACSRFRRDSELWRVNHAQGRPVQISPLFAEALMAALTAARLSNGDVDLTCGNALVRLGYDRD